MYRIQGKGTRLPDSEPEEDRHHIGTGQADCTGAVWEPQRGKMGDSVADAYLQAQVFCAAVLKQGAENEAVGAGAEIKSKHKTLRHSPWYTALTAPTATGGAPSVYTRFMQQLRFTQTRTQYITRIVYSHAVRPRPVRVADHRARALSRVPTHTTRKVHVISI